MTDRRVLLCCALLAVALPYLPRLVARVRGRERIVRTRWAFGDGD